MRPVAARKWNSLVIKKLLHFCLVLDWLSSPLSLTATHRLLSGWERSVLQEILNAEHFALCVAEIQKVLSLKLSCEKCFGPTQYIRCKVAGWLRMFLFPSDAELQVLLQANTSQNLWVTPQGFVIPDRLLFPSDCDWGARWRTWATHFWRQTKSLETQNVDIFPFVNLHDMFLQL